ncbi:hypothetical protein OPT61_g4950 [Boeremia exigua]|uniref:Uncharacterized protein n=1 Tax=Boeremia exigua TaxID=749465 RepID=A0ACC2IC24_9PLEO|nr:hypothetical protein OPT61_g4950 [Boeremia exigua]
MTTTWPTALCAEDCRALVDFSLLFWQCTLNEEAIQLTRTGNRAATMPRTKKAEPRFLTRVIAKAFFGLDVRNMDDEPRTRRATSEPRARSPSTGPRPPVAAEIKEEKTTGLLALPLEIRLRIYEQLLVSRLNHDRTKKPSSAVGRTNQKQILLHSIKDPQNRTMEPALLRTCKQVYKEANPMLYSHNVFSISEPQQMTGLIRQIRFHNLSLIKSLHIWVPHMATPLPWIQLLQTLADNAHGLRRIELAWGAVLDEGGSGSRGLGSDLDFVRALGQLRGLKELVISGFYARNWPTYLSETLGVQVKAMCGHGFEVNDSGSQELSYLENESVEELRNFKRYQQGTEVLIP